MDLVVVIPGIAGSALSDGEGPVWPPSVGQVLTGRTAALRLARPQLRVGRVVEQVACWGVYGTLLDHLRQAGIRDRGRHWRLMPFAYDWRRDLRQSGQRLARLLARWHRRYGPVLRIHLIGHSMGGLVARVALEDPALAQDREHAPKGDGAPDGWRGRVAHLVMLGTPQAGAVQAVDRVLNLSGEGLFGLSAAQVAGLAAQPGLPACAQLMPPATRRVVLDLRPGQRLACRRLDDLDTALAPAAWQLRAIAELHGVLDPARRPPTLRVVSVAGCGRLTPVALALEPTGLRVLRAPAGDGTVAADSAVLAGDEAFLLAGVEHLALVQDAAPLSLVSHLLGIAGVPAPSLAAMLQADEPGIGQAG